MSASADVLAVIRSRADRRDNNGLPVTDETLLEAAAAVAELAKRADQLLTGLAFPGLVKQSAKNPNAGFVDMRDWYALQSGIAELRAALAKFGGAQ